MVFYNEYLSVSDRTIWKMMQKANIQNAKPLCDRKTTFLVNFFSGAFDSLAQILCANMQIVIIVLAGLE